MNIPWHDDIEAATTTEEAVAIVRRYLSALSLHDLDRLPRYCDARRIRSDDDVDDLTFKLSQQHREAPPSARGAVEDAFGIVLHASLRISRLNRLHVQNVPPSVHAASGAAARQMH